VKMDGIFNCTICSTSPSLWRLTHRENLDLIRKSRGLMPADCLTALLCEIGLDRDMVVLPQLN